MAHVTSIDPPTEAKARLPRQIPYIIGNEACERFSFYGMRNILTVFLVGYLLVDQADVSLREREATDIFHLFVMGVYLFPLLGGWLADKWLGKYRTILWLSLVYCAGHACLAIFEGNKAGFYTGLFLIALGSGGIKPCVSSFVGDQFDQSNKHLAQKVYDAFYWIINFGSFFASLLIPLTLTRFGPSVAFGIPGLLMFIATAIFWAGRKHYVNVPPSPKDPHGFLEIAKTALLSPGSDGRRPGLPMAVGGVLLGLGSLFATPWIGFVSALCLGVVLFLAFFGRALSAQISRASGLHPEEDQVGAGVPQLLRERTSRRETIQRGIALEEDRLVGTHRERRAKLLGRPRIADRQRRHLAAPLTLLQLQSGLHRELVVGVDDVLDP